MYGITLRCVNQALLLEVFLGDQRTCKLTTCLTVNRTYRYPDYSLGLIFARLLRLDWIDGYLEYDFAMHPGSIIWWSAH
jgi:hypothetical protein